MADDEEILWAGRCLKRCLEAVGFVLAEFQPKISVLDPIQLIFVNCA